MITYSAVKGLAAWVFLAILAIASRASFAGDYNSLILDPIKQMPQGGRYSVSHFAKLPLATVRKAFHEARLPTLFFRVFKTRRIWHELITRPLLIPIWRRFCGVVPVLPKPALSADYNKETTTSRRCVSAMTVQAIAP